MRVTGVADSAWTQARQTIHGAPAVVAGAGSRGPVPMLPMPAHDRGRFTADGLASLIARMSGGYPGGAGWFVNERV